ncbi:regulator of G-protein signaling loco isoform X3 [Condylostylus longicornis]|uniref:regulator of G-protein signaling loco isoform X3 n=1 Tax=Condylostylus longicornis TaxID=2530218 RepID=UPI00244DD921|nr:regulator of G-protein signaling loco isoform X3 [Condylostylus longicornis]
MHHHHRRRKKRPNYNTRTVEVSRGCNGFGFTISGQKPCILSCIVENSPADQAGLKAGDFLISVNGTNVSKLPHEAVAQAIGNSFGTIRLQIAENYFSDSSEEEISIGHINRVKPRYIQHRHKMNRIKNVPSSQKPNLWREETKILKQNYADDNCIRQNQINMSENQAPVNINVDIIKKHSNVKSPVTCLLSPKASTSKEQININAAIRKTVEFESSNICLQDDNAISPLEYRAIVGYMGTIEMPRQITTSTKLQTVRSCIRKLQREKRSPSTVLMTILPNCLTLKNSNSVILAAFPASRLTYVTSSSESENRFFGLVTSAFHTHNENEDEGAVGGIINNQLQPKEITISNSCHVFVIDTKICEHSVHEHKAIEFQIVCTKDPISNLCLEFPNNSEYVVNLIRSMYTMKTMPFPIRNFHSQGINGNSGKRFNQEPSANSPQPSNHSEVTTTSSNSDSGIGFHNDCANISDRILVVDFPNIILNNRTIPVLSRPSGICHNIGQCSSGSSSLQTSPEKIQLPPTFPNTNQLQYKLNEFSKRVNMRPDQKVLLAASVLSEALANASISASNKNKNKSKLLTTKSCDDVLSSIERDEPVTFQKKKNLQMSMDDISILSSNKIKVQFQSPIQKKKITEHVFLPPGKPIRRTRKTSYPENNESKTKIEKDPKYIKNSEARKKNERENFSDFQKTSVIDNLINFSRKSGNGISKHVQESFEIWGSLQDIKKAVENDKFESHFIDGTYSEPDLLMSRALPSTNSSPFRRWGQSSFRTVRTTPDQRPTISRRPSSLAASENDVYTKSMDDFINDDVNSIHSHSDGGADIQIGRTKALAINFLNAINAQQNNSNNNHNIHLPTNSSNKFSSNHRVQIWGNSFEKLLEDPAGLHTFAEFLKKEFSAENIYFWTACERYHHINDDNERAQKAIEIYSKHLGTGACEPVNVDSQARSLAEEKLESADRNIFNYAQKQIYNLMKFDSYQRFIRSDLYKKCLEAEAKNQPLPYTGENLSDSLKTSNMLNSPGPSKLKKSASNAEDRRRKSLLPWHRKVRCKSRDRTNNNNDNGVADNNSEINPLSKSQSSSGNTLKLPHTNSTSDIHSSRSSLSSFDANTCLTSNPNTAFNSGSEESKRNFCRVIFSDGAATVTLTRPDQTVRQLIERLLEKRGFKYQFFDVILSPNGKALDLDSSSNILMSKEVQVEQRIAFKLDLPDPKVISVKSKPKKALCDVLKPILQKYNYRFEDVQILMRDTHEQIELSLPVTAIDGQRLSVVLLRNGNNLWKQQQLQKRNGLLLTTSSCSPIATAAVPDTYQHNLGAISKSYLPSNKNNLLSVPKSLGIQSNHQSTLDEITNKVFTEVLQGKVDSQENNMPKSVDLCSLRSDECASESSSIYDQTKFRDLNAATAKNFIKPKKPLTINTTSKFNVEKTQTSNSITTQTDENLNVNNNNNNSTNNNMQSSNSNLTGIKKPLIAKWKTGVKLQKNS